MATCIGRGTGAGQAIADINIFSVHGGERGGARYLTSVPYQDLLVRMRHHSTPVWLR